MFLDRAKLVDNFAFRMAAFQKFFIDTQKPVRFFQVKLKTIIINYKTHL